MTNIKFKKGAPPSVGWWPASVHKHIKYSEYTCPIRWWNGSVWSRHAHAYYTEKAAGYFAQIQEYSKDEVFWAKRWWE